MLDFGTFLTERLRLTLKYHSKLNPKIWKNDQLDDGVVDHLLDLSFKFAKFSGIDKSRVKDIVITGGNVNYNYTKFSDIDIHLMCDITGLDSDKLYTKKVEWANSNKELKVAGYPLEFYAADVDEKHYPKGQGVYSLMRDKWLIVPKHLGQIDVLTDPKVLDKVEYYIKYIKQWLLKHAPKEDILSFKEKMWRMRSAGLQRGGEFSVENVVYKDLRNRGLIDKLNQRLRELQDQ